MNCIQVNNRYNSKCNKTDRLKKGFHKTRKNEDRENTIKWERKLSAREDFRKVWRQTRRSKEILEHNQVLGKCAQSQEQRTSCSLKENGKIIRNEKEGAESLNDFIRKWDMCWNLPGKTNGGSQPHNQQINKSNNRVFKENKPNGSERGAKQS